MGAGNEQRPGAHHRGHRPAAAGVGVGAAAAPHVPDTVAGPVRVEHRHVHAGCRCGMGDAGAAAVPGGGGPGPDGGGASGPAAGGARGGTGRLDRPAPAAADHARPDAGRRRGAGRHDLGGHRYPGHATGPDVRAGGGDGTERAGLAIGPALAGAIIAATGPGLVFLLNALSFLAVIGALAAWRPKPEDRPGPPEQFDAAVRAGLRYAWHSHLIHYVLLRSGTFSLASAGLLALLPVYAKAQLGLGSGGLGLLYGAFGAGAAASALLLPTIRARVGVDGVVVAGTAAAAATLLALSFTRSPPLAALITFVAGAGWLLCLSVFNVAAQQVLPDWVRARGLALNLTVTAGAIAVGSVAWGAVATALGVPAAFRWGSIAVAVTLLAGVRWRFSPIATYDLSPAPLAEPDTPLTVPAGGPVFVTVTYQVQPGA